MKELLHKIYFLVPFLAAVVLVIVLYFMRYDTPGTEEALAGAASEYTETSLNAVMIREIPDGDGNCDGKGDLVLLCRSAGDETAAETGSAGSGDMETGSAGSAAIGDAETGSTGGAAIGDAEAGSAGWNGVVRFERGINGRYVPVESNLCDYSVPVHESNVNDESMGFFGGEDGSEAVTVFFSCNYPEDMARIEITCYDRDAYMEDGSIKPYTVTIEPDGTPYMEIVPVSFHLYDRDYRIYDREGNLRNYDDPVYHAIWTAGNDGNSKSRGGTGGSLETWDKYGLILLAGAGLSWWLRRRRMNGAA